ncbi:hypothetical protein BGZ73_004596 [Actinomortierella ambigua]|nr:hypothetical protein BGZ73_004596 [Actinomortierella ambigua]
MTNLGFSMYHLMAGLLLGVVKYVQILESKSRMAHPYTSHAHRAALMYGFASLQVAAMAGLSAWSERTNLIATGALQFYFTTAVWAVAAHGILRDTTNQFKPPYRFGDRPISGRNVRGFMWSLAVVEVICAGVLMAGMLKTFVVLS